MLRDSVTVAVVRTLPRAIQLAMITMRKSTHGFSFSFLLLRSHQTSQQTNFGRVRDQPEFPASIPALFQRFGYM